MEAERTEKEKSGSVVKGQSIDRRLLDTAVHWRRQQQQGSGVSTIIVNSFKVIAQAVTPSKRSLTGQQYRAIQWRLYGSSRKFPVLKCHDNMSSIYNEFGQESNCSRNSRPTFGRVEQKSLFRCLFLWSYWPRAAECYSKQWTGLLMSRTSWSYCLHALLKQCSLTTGQWA